MTEFTPVSGLIGGALIGLASAILALAIGRIAGISGIFARTLQPIPGDWGWRFTFVLGLVLGGMATMRWVPGAAAFTITESPLLLISAGLLVGFGTRLGNGCTSGHGVCGVARLSRRSLVATPVFMVAAILTVFVTRHLQGAS